MRRQLVIVRHAKSSWDDPSLDDHERPLAPRGRNALPRLAAHLGAIGATPDVVMCSTAVRTLATLDGLRAILPPDADVVIDERLYHAGEHWLVTQVQSLDAATSRVMVIGHNPGLHALAVHVVGDGDPADRARLARKFPTAAAATISFGGDWSDVDVGTGRLDDLFLARKPRS